MYDLSGCLPALDPDGKTAARIVELITTTYDALRPLLDPDRHVWHNVVCEPVSRLETSATGGFIYVHDLLRKLGPIEDADDPVIEQAFQGLKTFVYAGGLCSNCRGTAFGPPAYYLGRPQGWYDCGLFHGTMARRLR